jgi:hypothetical protein
MKPMDVNGTTRNGPSFVSSVHAYKDLQKTAFSTVGFSQRSFTDASETPNLLKVRFCFPYNVVKTRRWLLTTFGV